MIQEKVISPVLRASQLDAHDRQSIRASMSTSKENLNISVQTPSRKKKSELMKDLWLYLQAYSLV